MITATATRTIPPTETPQRTSRGGARHVLSLFMVCVVMLMAASGTGWAAVTAQTVQTLTVSAGVSSLRAYEEVNRHVNATGFRINQQGDLYLAYGDDVNIRLNKYIKSTNQWNDSLVAARNKRVHFPSLSATSNGLYLHASDFDRTGVYHSVSDSSLYFLPTGSAIWSKQVDIYTNKAWEDSGPSIVADRIFPDPSGNIHVATHLEGWWAYGHKQYEMIYNTTQNTLGSQIPVSERQSGGPDNCRNCTYGGDGNAVVLLGDNQELQVPLFDGDTSTLFLAQSAAPYGSWTLTDKSILSGMLPQQSFQDAQGHVHLLYTEKGTEHLYYSYDYGTPVEIVADKKANIMDVIVKSGTVYVIFAEENAPGYNNAYLMTKPVGGTWGTPVQITNESSKLAYELYFAKPFGYRQEPADIYFVYSVMDGTGSGGSYNNSHIKVARLEDGLVAWYPFNGNANDASGNGNNGTVNGATLTTDRFGNANGAYSFNGSSDFILIPDGTNFNTTDEISLSLWLKPNGSQGQYAVLIDKTHNTPDVCSWALQQNNYNTNNFYFTFGDGSNWLAPEQNLISTASINWNHLLVTKQGSLISYYLNGNLVNTQTALSSTICTNGSQPLAIGAWNAGNSGRFFNGSIDDIRIYNRALSAAEVSALYQGEAPVPITVTTTPEGLAITVDGATYTSPRTFTWAAGSRHTIGVPTTTVAPGTRRVFASWSDGGSASHTITTPASDTTYTAATALQYQLTTAVNPAGTGVASPATGAWYAPNTVVPVKAFPNSGYGFISWAGPVAGSTSATTSVTMTGPASITATMGGSPVLTPMTTAKSGTTPRTWSVKLENSGQSTATGASITGLVLTRTAGTACTPVISAAQFPVALGDIAAGGSATGSVTIDFNTCAATNRYTATISYSSNGGAVSGSKSYANQFK